ncbi:MAG: guanylate kinase [Oscillospiraceae bacterium]|jgi:guanylate kinase|nr:guanylate kinase [Oscillospiraceae bacterium]
MSENSGISGDGLIVVVSGPSGTGKDTVIEEILKKNKGICVSVSMTTRNPRTCEKNGKNYHFLSEESFKEKVRMGEMIEHAKYCGNYYGTSLDFVKEKIKNGIDVLLKIEVKGARQIRKNCPDAIHIFILPPSMKELSRRLKNRQTESEKGFEKRIKTASEEIASAKDYDYIVINKDKDVCAKDICSIIYSEKLKTSRVRSKTDVIIREIF